MTIQIDKIIRSKRKSLYLVVDTNAKLIVKAPLRCSNRAIRESVERHQDWILHKQQYAGAHHRPSCPKKYIASERFLYLGKEYELFVTETTNIPLEFKRDKFVLAENRRINARDLFIRWYSKEAFRIISDRANLYSYISGIKYRKLNISDAKSRWGSCSPNGNLNFSWTLIMAPLEVIDYVIMHELVHIKIKNHSKQFWQKVQSFIPEFKCRRNWLKENQNLLNL